MVTIMASPRRATYSTSTASIPPSSRAAKVRRIMTGAIPLVVCGCVALSAVALFGKIASSAAVKEESVVQQSSQQQRPQRVDESAVSATPKLVFMFLMVGRHNREQLWLDFFADADPDHYLIRVHPHPRHARDITTPLFRDNIIADLVETQWSTPSLMTATRNLMAASLQDGNATIMTLLSDSCIPLRSFRDTYNELVGRGRGHAASRFTLHAGYAQDDVNSGTKPEHGASPELALRMETSIFPEFRALPEGYVPKHSQFFAIIRSHAELVMTHFDTHLERYWIDSDVPDESLILSLLAVEIVDPTTIVNSNNNAVVGTATDAITTHHADSFQEKIPDLRNYSNNNNNNSNNINSIIFSRWTDLPKYAARELRLSKPHSKYKWYNHSLTCELREIWLPSPELLDDVDIEFFRRNTTCIFLRKSKDGYMKNKKKKEEEKTKKKKL